MRRPTNFVLAGLCLTLLGCSDRSPSPTGPVLSSPVLAVAACDISGARSLVNQLFPNAVKQTAQALLQVIQNSGAGTAAATDAGFGILELISTYGPNLPQIGSDLANAILPCMDIVSEPTDFTGALSDTGAFAVRGSSSSDIAAVVSRDGLWGMEPPLNTTTNERYTWNAITVPANTRLLVYGARISATGFTNEQQVGTIFDWFTFPVVTFDPGVVVGTCIVDNGPQYLIQHHLLGEIVPSATISFCPVGVTSVRSAEGWSPAAVAQRVFDFFSPRPLLATALGVRPPGGSVGSLSPSVAVNPGTITVKFPKQIADGKTNVPITFKGGDPVSVTVEPAGGTDLDGAVVQLIAIANLGSPVVATGNTAVTNDGVAVFPNLSLSKAGGYRFITKLIGFGQNNAAGFTIVEAESNGFNLKQTK